MLVITRLPLFVLSPLFSCFTSDSSDSSRVRFV
jgi:hypothetical protein